jgi:hypothetical protein
LRLQALLRVVVLLLLLLLLLHPSHRPSESELVYSQSVVELIELTHHME